VTLRSFLTSRRGLLAIAVWVLWYAGVLGIRAWLRSSKDPRAYTGTCYRPNGHAVRCTLEQWLAWDATPYVDVYIIAGGLLAAALTGLLFLRHLARPGRPPVWRAAEEE
jgi:hypothetical protein